MTRSLKMLCLLAALGMFSVAAHAEEELATTPGAPATSTVQEVKKPHAEIMKDREEIREKHQEIRKAREEARKEHMEKRQERREKMKEKLQQKMQEKAGTPAPAETTGTGAAE